MRVHIAARFYFYFYEPMSRHPARVIAMRTFRHD